MRVSKSAIASPLLQNSASTQLDSFIFDYISVFATAVLGDCSLARQTLAPEGLARETRGTVRGKGGPHMATIFGAGGPIIVLWTVRGDRPRPPYSLVGQTSEQVEE